MKTKIEISKTNLTITRPYLSARRLENYNKNTLTVSK